MANRLKMATVDSILRLHAQGRSQRQIALDLQGRKLVGHHTHAPTFLIGARVALAIGEDLVRRVNLIALTKGAETARRHRLAFRCHRALDRKSVV